MEEDSVDIFNSAFLSHPECGDLSAEELAAEQKKRAQMEEGEEGVEGHLPPSTSSTRVTPHTTHEPSCSNGSNSMPGYAFCLPNLDVLSADFRTFVEKDLIETSTQKRLENSRHLNWWSSVGARLWPLSTTGDGNCLLHAASLGMWGLHDRQLLLRNAVYEILLKGSRRNALWRRWKWSEWKANEAAGLQLSDEEWATEWRNVVALAAPTPRKTDEASTSNAPSDLIYEGLEAIHVFALAHVLKRPIVVVSDTVLRNAKGEELSPVGFGGVYLPLECPPEQCHRSPLVLCYDSAHFSPLVCMKDGSHNQQIIPMTDVNRNILPLHFAVDAGPDFTWWKDDEDERIAARVEPTDSVRLTYMNEYMDLVRIEMRRGSARRTTAVRRESCLHSLNSNSEKSLTLASTGMASGQHEKKRILNEITQQVKRTLRLGQKKKENTLDVKTCVEALARTNCIVAAKLNVRSHEYSDELATEYITAARHRFTNAKEKPAGRARLGRSFSASSLSFTCINDNCNQSASQESNFFCECCLERQKALLTSFSSDGNRILRRMIVHIGEGAGNMKSSTMPALSARNGNNNGERSSPVSSSPSAHPFLVHVSPDGCSHSLPVSAVADENGVTHYFLPSPSSPALSTHSTHSTSSSSALSCPLVSPHTSPPPTVHLMRGTTGSS